MTRMNDIEYTQAFAELETTTELSDALLEKLTIVAVECNARGLESAMGKRSLCGKSNDQGRRFINLMDVLNERFSCKINRYQSGDMFEVHPAGWSRWV